MSTATIKIGDKEVPYHVHRGNDPKYIHLKFTKNLELEITLPMNSHADVEGVLRKKRVWIERKYHVLSNRRCVFDDRRVLYRGVYHDIYVASSNEDEPPVIMQDGKAIVHLNKRQHNYLPALKEWMKTETTKLVIQKLGEYTQCFNINYRDVYVKTTKQWGYCTNKGDLVFNWQLIGLPDTLIDYIVLHELAHLSEFSHSKKFRALLGSVCTDFRERRAELNYFCISKLRVP